jgi:hypothetical protein
LAFLPMVGADALVFTLLHETGHHFAPGRRFASDPMLACDCAADQWAVTKGAEILCQSSGRKLDLVKALDGLDAMISTTPVESEHLTTGIRTSTIAQCCWALHWPTRKSRLSGERKIVLANRCYFEYHRMTGGLEWVP